MKRGWITWDQTELPRAAFEARLDSARKQIAGRDLPAMVVYTDVWRSNYARHFSNYMPYWNRALLVIPRDSTPVLLCSSPARVFPWIRSVTILEEILPSPNLPRRVFELCAERNWTRVGALDFDSFPHDLRTPLAAGAVTIEDVSLPNQPDQWEVAMHRHAVHIAREGLMEEISSAAGLTDHEFTGRLERRFRRAGAEDLVVLVTNGRTPPAPARGERLGPAFSVALALEYRGHWAKIVRNRVTQELHPPATAYTETLSGSYPYEAGGGPVFAARWETAHQQARLFHGETFHRGPAGIQLL